MSYRPRVKICGITRPQDGLEAARQGADAVGLVFYARSPRAVTPAQAKAILRALPPFITSVGLFVDAQPGEVQAVLEQVALDVLQFHGDEEESYCARFGRPFIKAVRMRPGTDLHAVARTYASAQGLLLDTYVPGTAGGTGMAFDWTRIPRELSKPIVLAGGLTPDNVAEALAMARPYAVDVSGGVEAARGIKDAAKMAAFVRAVNHAAMTHEP
jgi:phosphoribosylanthranilate isomerase